MAEVICGGCGATIIGAGMDWPDCVCGYDYDPYHPEAWKQTTEGYDQPIHFEENEILIRAGYNWSLDEVMHELHSTPVA